MEITWQGGAAPPKRMEPGDTWTRDDGATFYMTEDHELQSLVYLPED